MSVVAVVLAANVEPWQGASAIVALAGVVGYLFRWADRRVTESAAAVAAQEKTHVEELARVRLECEARLATQAREFAEALRRDHLDNRAHEDEIRREFVNVVATIGDQTAKSAESLTEVLGKLHDRFAGRSRPPQ